MYRSIATSCLNIISFLTYAAYAASMHALTYNVQCSLDCKIKCLPPPLGRPWQKNI